MIEAFTVEADEGGWWVTITGDFTVPCRKWYQGDGGSLTMRLLDTDGLVKAGRLVGEWEDEGRLAAAAHELEREIERSLDEIALAYDPSDPKSPGYHDRMSAIYDSREGK